MNIRSARFILCLSVSLVALGLALPAAAQSHGGGRGGGGGVHASGGHREGGRGGSRGGGGWQRGGPGWWGVGLGLGLGWGTAYYGDPYGGYPGYYAPYDSQVVVEQAPQYQYQSSMPPQDGVAPPNVQGAASWSYCDSSRTYYPYVKQCAEGWRAVPATPPAAGH